MLFSLSSSEAVAQRCFVKKVFLEISQNSQENTCARVSFLIKLQAVACNFIKKETLAQLFSCEFCEISKITSSGSFCKLKYVRFHSFYKLGNVTIKTTMQFLQ